MKQHCQITYGVILLSFITLMETASVNVSISSPDIQNGSSINLAATFDPTVGDVNLKDVVCEYTKPGGGAPNTRLTTYHTGLRQIVPSSTLSASESSRLTILSSGKPLMLTIAPITFEDEKRQFFCTLEYYIGLSAVIIRSKQHTLENVYSPAVLNVADSMQTSTSITGGIAANFTCIATGRPAPTITWQYSLGVSATISNTFVGSPLITVTGILSIHNPTQTMDGLKVTCFVSHQFTPMINRTTTLSVFYRPINTILIIYPQGPKLNEDITLNCNAIGKPNVITYRFFINQTYIGNSTSGNLTVKSNNCLRYNGYYKCIPVNVRGEGEEKQQLVVVKDNVRTSTASSSLTFNETQSTTLFCTVSGCPEPSVSWSRNGVSLNRYGNSLTLPLLNSGHAGRYSCNASNAFTNSSSQIEVTVNYKPVGTQLSSNNAKPLVNSSVGFSCTSDAVPVANYRFVRVDGSGEREVSSSNSEITGILMVSRIIHAPNAYNVTYKCIPHNMLGNGLEQRVMVDIQVPARIEQFTLTPRTVNETGNVSIECISSGNPLPNITITGPNNVTVQHSIGKATLNNVNRNQAGLYTCKTSNGVSSPVNATIELVVNYIPVISSLRAAPPQTYTGSYSIITCVAIGTPRPSYRYYNEIGTLLIDTVAVVHPVTLRYEDYPRYRATFRCVPYNIMGEGTAQNVTVEILVPPRLSVSMSPETVNETDNAAFSCAVLAANPSSNITLRGLLNQTLLHTSGTTILSNLNRDDAGTYSCVASNGLRGGPVIETAKLSVNHAPDQVQFTASTPKPISGSSVTLNCMARGSPSPSFRFILVNGSSTKIIQNGPSSSCVIFKLDYKDYSNYTATYRCISYNTFGDSSPQDETLNIQVRPVLSFSITPSIVTETQNVTANCKVLAANPAPNITIRGNNKEIIPHIGGQAELELITIAQAGEYSCIADNGVVGTTTSTATLNVNYAPDRVDLSSSSMTPLNGSSVTLNCSSSGLPPPHRFVFSRINGPTQTAVQDSASSIYLNRMINFKNFISYKAIFACVPYNTVGRGLSKNITLDIQVRPEVSVTSPITALEGDNVNFRCTVTAANPTASVMWRGPSNTVLSSSPLLTLNSVNRNQVGEYTCIASNGISPNARKTTFLSVNYSPRFKENSKVYEKCIGENASILCSAVGSPIPDISLYLNGILLASNVRGLRYHVAIDSTSRFGAYMCSSKNSVGTVNITTIIKVKPPGNVTNINLRVNKNTIRVTWDLPQCKGNIKEVKVQYRKKGECNWGMRSSTVTTTDKEFIINGLDNGVEYEVRIVVVDISGKEHMMQASGTAKIAQGKAADTSIGASTIALYTLIPLFLIIIAALLVWIMRLKKRATSIPMSSSNANQNMHSHYMDLELTRINSESQPYATITNPGALAYEKIPEGKSHYMELNQNPAGNEKHPNSSKDYEVLQK